MGGFPRTTAVAVFLALALSAPAHAELLFTLNTPGGVSDQPTSVVDGTRVHVAYISGSTTSGPFLLRYALLDGTKDFTRTFETTRENVLLAGPMPVIDNSPVPPSTAGDNVYVDARHPRIAFHSATVLVIVFQGRPTSLADPFILYRAVVHYSGGNTVDSISVRKIKDGANDVYGIDPAVALDTNDNTARLAYSVPPGSPGGGSLLSFVRYARVAMDNAQVVSSFLLSSGIDNAILGSDGVQPLPCISLDTSRRAHVAWSAAPSDATKPSKIYYAMIRAGLTGTSGVDNVVIPAVSVFEGGRRWSFPGIGAHQTNSIFVLANDTSFAGVSGIVNWVEINPEVALQTNWSIDNVAWNQFIPHGPGTTPYQLYHPDILFDGSGSAPVFIMTGYGFEASRGGNYVLSINPAAVTWGTTAFLTYYPEQQTVLFASLDNDYTRPGVGFLSGRVMLFWSGYSPAMGDPADGSVRNLYFATVPTGNRPPNPSKQSGCAMVAHPRGADASGIASAAVLLLPALLLGARRIARSRRRRPEHVEP